MAPLKSSPQHILGTNGPTRVRKVTLKYLGHRWPDLGEKLIPKYLVHRWSDFGEKKSPLIISGTDGPTWVRKITPKYLQKQKTQKHHKNNMIKNSISKNRMVKK